MARTPTPERRAAASNCLTDEELTRLLEGLEHSDRRDVLMLHLDLCPGCRMVLAEATRHLASTKAARSRWARAIGLVAVILLVALALALFR